MRFCPVLICCLFVTNLLSQEAPPPQAPYVEREEKQFNFFPGGKIEIFAEAPGSLKIIGWQKGSVRMEAEKIIYYLPPEQAKAEMQKLPVRTRWNQTNATIRTAENPSFKMEVNITLYVPGYKTDLRAKLNRGDFSIEQVNGWVEATIMSEGSIEVKSMAGYFSANTRRGDITVDMAGKRWDGLECAALTQYGSASLYLPLDFSAALLLETRDGKVTVDYPPQVVEGETVPPQIAIRKNSQSLKASVGDGGAPIKLVTYSGDITLSKKE
jgi:hypothetical protein